MNAPGNMGNDTPEWRKEPRLSEPCHYLSFHFPSAEAAAAWSNHLRETLGPTWEVQHVRLFKSGETIPLCQIDE